MSVIYTLEDKFWNIKSISEASKMKITYLYKAKTKIVTKLALLDTLPNVAEQAICLKKAPKSSNKMI